MKVKQLDAANFRLAYGIDMATISEETTTSDVNFSYGRVAPAGETTPHSHHESEVFIVIKGHGSVIGGGQELPIQQGSVIVCEPFDNHTIRNTGDTELVFVDLYFLQQNSMMNTLESNASNRLKNRPVFVFSTPPTPNGDLHLGHLSGPYLGADVYVRYLKLQGINAYHLTGSDDYQSYVVARANQEAQSPASVAAHYASEIQKTLAMMDIHVDQFTVTGTDTTYATGLQAFFDRLIGNGVDTQELEALFDPDTGAYLYEVDVSGGCPFCHVKTNGNICEQCGHPNVCIDLSDPVSNISGKTPLRKTATPYALNLNEHSATVSTHHQRSKVSPRLKQLAAEVFSRGPLIVPMTHPSSWGVTPTTRDDEVIWVWPEMAYGFLHGISALGKKNHMDWKADAPGADWKIVHFFGYDNSFYHSILYPILYKLAYPHWDCDIDYNENEFYLLDGLKFSTSRRHAVWGKDILSEDNVDAVRYYLGWTRGEDKRTNFTLDEFKLGTEDMLVGQWQRWLTALGNEVHVKFDDCAPDAGVWTPRQVAYLNTLKKRVGTLGTFYDANGFALNSVVSELNAIVTDAIRLSDAYARVRDNPDLHDEYRTSIALQLATAKILATVSSPLMPRFAGRLAAALGQEITAWPNDVALVPSGTTLSLNGARFFKRINAVIRAEEVA